MSLSAEFPGIGDPSRRGRLSDGDGTIEVIPDGALHNTNPGWIALALGVFLLAAAAAYYLAWNRKVVSIVAAASSGVVFIVCVSYLIDVRGAFDDPIEMASLDFAPGLGLIAATALSIVVAILSVAAFIVDQRSSAYSPP